MATMDLVVKRPADEPVGDLSVAIKRQRPNPKVPAGVKRSSSLESPIMLLSGHADAVLTCKFNPLGTVVASGSHDKHIFLWNVQGECDNFMMMKGHRNAITELHWTTDGETLITASPDMSVRAWDAVTGKQIKKMAEHSSFVNSCCPARRGPQLIVSGSDDGTAKLWDLLVKGSVKTFSEDYQVTAVAFADASDKVYTGGIDNTVRVWDLRKDETVMQLKGHTDTISGMSVSPDGTFLLTNGMDATLRCWDMRPYAPTNRCVKLFSGHQHNFEKNLLKCSWSPDGKMVSAGSSCRNVFIWDVTSRRVLYKLPGHKGCVDEVSFHPKEPVVASCSHDKTLYLGEIAAK